MAINVGKEAISDFVKKHAMYYQDKFDDYPSFIYKVIFNGREYISRSREELVEEIHTEENK